MPPKSSWSDWVGGGRRPSSWTPEEAVVSPLLWAQPRVFSFSEGKF